MKCVIIYFSQTSNTENVARSIQKGIKNTAGNCELIKIKEANPHHLIAYDLIGIGSPVFGRAPENVRDFISNLRFVGGKHLFVFCTHGTHPEHFFPSLYPALRQRGVVVIGMRNWYGSCALVHMPHPYYTDGHPDAIDLREAEEFGKEMVDRSVRISAGETGLIPAPPPIPATSDKEVWADKREDRFESMVKYHREKCLYPKCNLCVDNCPVDGIDLTVDPPVIASPCINCEFCERICPTGAMDGGVHIDFMASIASKNAKTHLEPFLKQAEVEGRFRRLVPPEKVGYETPIYKTWEKHPYWIIGKGLPF